ncbi:hypothetical protein [Rhodospirillum rubrum]|uniref:Uncharacterized protein n=1 Tax=Rhodospirillum rubrum (strain ATCC 11170 / ATH 1.1.1 / DSM 467 / LMG 4362 / NCIMB 8255 / S1) TaxID=269796 RepID=Q2RN27_RHORT|nr:hypothetical protein [Rhodospirillum rubrum]ABC24468.1 hypothetical protein Rru_A3674 [Rhodospirillum rubrum ATCC 11170]AEO50219.1 hypothetical protein F11_18795 [Rhodospirillum rubrum F11]MBK5956194.1 hypothetical protein [Rhodospirillum rubrum]QXG80387.1 hypothetical protein KUL73_18950 [Rhodospirillum rubrum]HAP99802.1 hypothetical protein [Rhodospirillum rubrum]
MIPDTLHGALLLSLIDFVLSIAIISAIGILLALFPLLNKLGAADEAKMREGGH